MKLLGELYWPRNDKLRQTLWIRPFSTHSPMSSTSFTLDIFQSIKIINIESFIHTHAQIDRQTDMCITLKYTATERYMVYRASASRSTTISFTITTIFYIHVFHESIYVL